MKIVFLLTLIPAISICSESHKVERGPPHQRPPMRTHLLHHPSARPDYAPINQGHCHGPKYRECFEWTIEYAYAPYPTEYPYYDYESYIPIPRPAQSLPKRLTPEQSPPASHLKETKYQDHCQGPNRQDCFIHNVEYPSYLYPAEYPYYDSYRPIPIPVQSHPERLTPEQSPPSRHLKETKNQDHCQGPNRQDCFIRNVEYPPYLYPAEYSYYDSYRPIPTPAQSLPERLTPEQSPPASHLKETKNQDHCHGPNRQDCFIRNVEYPPYLYPEEYQYYYYESYRPDVRPAPGLPKKLPSPEHPPVRNFTGPNNPDHCHGPNRQDCFKRNVEYSHYQYSEDPYYVYESYRPIARPQQGLPKNPPPVQRPKDRRFRVLKNPDHCHGPISDSCYITTVEYPSQYSAEHPDESYSSPLRRSFCPKRYSWPCYQKVHECCSDEDCHPIQFCCFESCGNTCQFPVSFPTDGFRVPQNDRKCRVAPTFGRG